MAKDNGVICGLCYVKHNSNSVYLNHKCSITGYTPKDQEHFGSRFINQSKKALERTGSLSTEKKNKINDKIKKIKDENIDDRIMRSQLNK